jgi:hypothetical protein
VREFVELALVLPPRASSQIDHDLVALTEAIVTRGLAEECGGLLAGRFGYGADYANSVFTLRPYYGGPCTCGWDDAEDGELEPPSAMTGHTPRCAIELPNFRHHASGLELRWYKWIGRDMEANRTVSPSEWQTIMRDCFASVEA